MAEPYPLARIASEHYSNWIKGLYRKYKKTMPTDEIIDEILSTCENHPLYVQQFFYFLWKESEITKTTIKHYETKILRRRFHEYANIWDKLTPNQKKACSLLCIVHSAPKKQVFPLFFCNIFMAGMIGTNHYPAPGFIKASGSTCNETKYSICLFENGLLSRRLSPIFIIMIL